MGGRHLKHVCLWRSCVFRRVPQVQRAAECENAELSSSADSCQLRHLRADSRETSKKPEAPAAPCQEQQGPGGGEDEERAEKKKTQSADRFICRAGRQQALVEGREGQVGHMI